MLDERTTTFSWEDDAAAKTEKALALAQRMIDWFRDNYEDPAESTPFCSEEGGYMYLCGGPYDAREELGARFAADDGVSVDELDEIINLAVEEIEADGIDEWAKVLPDDDLEPDDNVVRLLRAHNHYWGKGHVHRFEANIGKTACGRELEACPGDMDWGSKDEVTCKACLSALKRNEER